MKLKKLVLLSFLMNCFSILSVDITGLDKIQVLQALYLAAKPQGMGIVVDLMSGSSLTLTDKDIKGVIDNRYNIDYLKGRVMKIDLSGNTVDTYLYNRDNGYNAAEKVIASLRKQNFKKK